MSPAPPALSARTQLCGIVLHPAGHTRSPAMHNAAFATLGLDAVYLAFDVTPSALGDAIAGARALRLRQLAVSIPHKESVATHLDEVDETARAIGAVNTVTRHGDRMVGSNTDWLGAVTALEREGSLDGARAVVLGAGGTARAVTFGLLRRGAEVVVLNRTPAKALALAREPRGTERRSAGGAAAPRPRRARQHHERRARRTRRVARAGFGLAAGLARARRRLLATPHSPAPGRRGRRGSADRRQVDAGASGRGTAGGLVREHGAGRSDGRGLRRRGLTARRARAPERERPDSAGEPGRDSSGLRPRAARWATRRSPTSPCWP